MEAMNLSRGSVVGLLNPREFMNNMFRILLLWTHQSIHVLLLQNIPSLGLTLILVEKGIPKKNGQVRFPLEFSFIRPQSIIEFFLCYVNSGSTTITEASYKFAKN